MVTEIRLWQTPVVQSGLVLGIRDAFGDFLALPVTLFRFERGRIG